MPIDLTELRGYISDMYTDVATLPRGAFHFPTGRPLLETLGYSPPILDRIPASALESFAGVGHYFTLDAIREGEHVLDCGSGAGTDSLYAGVHTGPKGRVIGIDMTDAMLEKARKGAIAAGFDHVSFVKGHIEALPFEDASFDVVISNGVINLSPLKSDVFGAIRRVLKPGGRLMFSDIVTGVELPESVRENCTLWAECIGGAQEHNRYLRMVEEAGLKIEKTTLNEKYAFTQESTMSAASKFKVHSINVLARRPA
jgi:arsenite methyltransferase